MADIHLPVARIRRFAAQSELQTLDDAFPGEPRLEGVPQIVEVVKLELFRNIGRPLERCPLEHRGG